MWQHDCFLSRLFIVGTAEDKDLVLVDEDAAVRDVLERVASANYFLPPSILYIVADSRQIEPPDRILQARVQILTAQDVHVLAIGRVAHVAAWLRDLTLEHHRNPGRAHEVCLLRVFGGSQLLPVVDERRPPATIAVLVLG